MKSSKPNRARPARKNTPAVQRKTKAAPKAKVFIPKSAAAATAKPMGIAGLVVFLLVNLAIIITVIGPALSDRIAQRNANADAPELGEIRGWLARHNVPLQQDLSLMQDEATGYWTVIVNGNPYMLLRRGSVAVAGVPIDLESDTVGPNGLRASIQSKASSTSQVDTLRNAANVGREALKQGTSLSVSEDGSALAINDTKIARVGYDAEGNLMEAESQRQETQAIYDKIIARSKKWGITYPSLTKQKEHIIVFTDPTCPACQKLHKSLDELRRNGITVTYLMFPRALGHGADSYEARTILTKMKNAWCAKDRQSVFSAMYSNATPGEASCEGLTDRTPFPAEEHYIVGQVLGMSATPFVVLSTGNTVTGYSNIKRLLSSIREGK